ncbi:MAG: hypothetical protein FJX75_06990 [Armatimonadetes bacterium]|nr:hypothetical protein [Armatimonadota bacterium]
MSLRVGLALIAIVGAAQVGGAEVAPEWAAEHLGVYLWPTYPRLEGFTLPELVPITEALGTRVVRVTLEGHFGREGSWVDLLRAPAMRGCVSRFPTVILTLSDHSGRQYEPEWTRAQYEALTEYLLQAYRDTGKTFVLGLWESDHWLPLDDKGLAFLRARQEGITRAREQSGERGVRVLCMVEVTKAEGDCVATKLLPQAPPEVVSLSWWAHAADVGGALRTLRAGLPEATLMVGEMGLSGRRSDPERPAKLLAAIDEARQAGAEWVVLWRLDDWEYGLVGAKPEGGDTSDLWPVIWPLLHGGSPSGEASWALTGNRRREERVLAGGSVRVNLGDDVESIAFGAEAGARDVMLTGEGLNVRLASVLPPQSRIEVGDEGCGRLQIGPVRAESADDWQPWRAEGLVWNSEFAVWQTAARGADGFVEVTVDAEYPILGGSLWMTGRKATEGDWGVRVRGYQGEWIECPQVYDWRGEQLVAQFPASFPSEWGPTRSVTLRFWTRTDDETKDWVWTTSITSLRATLDLDTRGVGWPNEGTVTWSTEGAAAFTVVRRP